MPKPFRLAGIAQSSSDTEPARVFWFLWAVYPEGYLLTKHRREGREYGPPLQEVRCRDLAEVHRVLQQEGLEWWQISDLISGSRTLLFARAHYIPEALFFERHYRELREAERLPVQGFTLVRRAPREVREQFEALRQNGASAAVHSVSG